MKPLTLVLSLLVLLLVASVSEACPTCKLALEEGPDHSQQGYAYSIMFMMAMPFTIALGWTIFIVRCIRRQGTEESELLVHA